MQSRHSFAAHSALFSWAWCCRNRCPSYASHSEYTMSRNIRLRFSTSTHSQRQRPCSRVCLCPAGTLCTASTNLITPCSALLANFRQKLASPPAVAYSQSPNWLLTPESAKALETEDRHRIFDLAIERFSHHVFHSPNGVRGGQINMAAKIDLTLDVWKPTEILRSHRLRTTARFL